jgi:hypothetical protein
MQLTDLLSQTGGLQSMARELDIDPQQAASGAEALLPAILGGFQKTQAQAGGAGGLADLLGRLGGGGLMDQVLSPEPTDVGQGNEVLGQIFGSKDVSRTVTQSAAARTGLDPALLRRMLPMLAMLVAGFMAKQQGAAAVTEGSATTAGGGLGDLLGGLLGGRPGAAAAPGGGLASMLDFNGDGNALDDILRMAGKAMR